MFLSEVDTTTVEPNKVLIAELVVQCANGGISKKQCCALYHQSMLRDLCGLDNLSANHHALILELIGEEIELEMFSLEQACERYHALMISTMATKELKDYETPLLGKDTVVMNMLFERVDAGLMAREDCCLRFNELISRDHENRVSMLEADQRRYMTVKSMDLFAIEGVWSACDGDGTVFDEIVDQISM